VPIEVSMNVLLDYSNISSNNLSCMQHGIKAIFGTKQKG
jgi:hypothetical protein